MKKILVILLLLVLAGVVYGKEPVKKGRNDMLAFGAVLGIRNEETFSRLKPANPNDKESLKEDWSISNRKSAIEVLDWLVNEGHRTDIDEVLNILKAGKENEYEGLEEAAKLYKKCNNMLITTFKMDKKILDKVTTMAWDTDRLVNVARWCYDLKYISEEEAWNYIESAKKLSQSSFDSWEEYYASNVYGRALAYNGDPQILLNAGEALLKDKNSIWKKVKFK
jgi:hypothetical protein